MNPTDQPTNSGVFAWRLPPGYGKYEFCDRWFRRDDPLSETAPECFIFYREAVERGDVSVIHWLASPSRLARLRGRIHFAIDGYGEDDRELFEIPEVRSFFAALLKRLPCGIYFASTVDPRPIQFLAACTCDPLLVVRTLVNGEVGVQTEEVPLHRFCVAGFKCHTLFCELVDVELHDALEHFTTVVEFLVNRPKNNESQPAPRTER